MPAHETTAEIGELARRLRGRLLTPGDQDWDTVPRPWNLRADQRPAAIVDPAGAGDIRCHARVRAGVRCADLLAAGSEHGLAFPVGSVPDTGVAGYAMFGGVGLLARALGFAAYQIAAEVVTADGRRSSRISGGRTRPSRRGPPGLACQASLRRPRAPTGSSHPRSGAAWPASSDATTLATPCSPAFPAERRPTDAS